jgi:anti-sigma-K factor RskA
MSSLKSDDLQQLAGEYVLGTLSAERRRHVESELPRNPELREAVQYWEAHLLPLTGLVRPEEPSTQLWPRIERSLGVTRATAPARSGSGLARWWNNLNFWRTLAAGGFVAASAMAMRHNS